METQTNNSNSVDATLVIAELRTALSDAHWELAVLKAQVAAMNQELTVMSEQIADITPPAPAAGDLVEAE